MTKRSLTAWHPLFAELLKFALPKGFEQIAELSLTSEPQRIDLVVVRRGKGIGPQLTGFASITERLSDHNLFEFKSPKDQLTAQDLPFTIGKLCQYQAIMPWQNLEDLALFFVTASLDKGDFKKAWVTWKLKSQEIENGLWELTGQPWKMWCVECNDVWQSSGNENLLLFTEDFAKHPAQYLNQGLLSEHLVVWLSQQLGRYRQGRSEMPVQYSKDFQDMLEQAMEEYLANLPLEKKLAGLTPEQRLSGLAPEQRLSGLAPEQRLSGLAPEQRLSGLAPEQRLSGLAPEQRLSGLAPEELLKGLSEETKAALKKLLLS